MPGSDKTCNQFQIQFFLISRRYHSKWLSNYISHWSVIEHRTRKQDIEVGKYTAQNLENMADLHGES